MNREDLLRALPSVDAAVKHLEQRGAASGCPRRMLVRAVRAAIERLRVDVMSGALDAEPPGAVRNAAIAAVETAAARAGSAEMVSVINATGVIIHTNLGRAPLPRAALEAISRTAAGYCDLEYDLGRGDRGSRDEAVKEALCELTGAEDALVVNNNAAAVMLALDTLARGREVVVSRSELIEIGGAFRLHEVFEKSGATLVEVGTTNRTRIEDFERAVRAQTAALMSAHWSNYAIVGFVDRVPLEELAALGARRGIPVIHDLGSGLLAPGDAVGLHGEASVAESLGGGVSLCTMSGDKLIGGPQAGIAVGSSALVRRMRANPLARALRPCKLTLAALQATLNLYLAERERDEIPVLRMLTASVDELEERARSIVRIAGPRCASALRIVDLESRVGGGAAPERVVASKGIEIATLANRAEAVATRMLHSDRPVVVRLHEGRVLVDLRTVLPSQDEALAACIAEAVNGNGA
ncbi:MAG: L-seryl-tRNA(Sec) selenium transferase [Candidatus Eisenbacteria bacterium]|nr:L-seryl-tRNA(Sec) selenium transferase [Candidatus Eisenbacteria bacterium]